MADTKISDLTAASALTGTEEFPCSDGTATTKAATAAQIKTWTWKGGSTTAGSWPVLGSGSVLTTPEAGAFEYDGSALFFSPGASNRAGILLKYVILQDATYTLTSTTSAQKLFNASTNGALTLPTGWYIFKALIALTSMSGTSGNGQFQLLGAGTATLGGVLYHVVGVDGASGTAATQTGSWATGSSSAASAVTAGTNTNALLEIRGSFEVTATGTIIPSIALVTAAAAVVSVGSYFKCFRVGAAGGNVTVGPWS